MENFTFGIDAGSTTTKAALIDQDGNLVFDFYQGNEGNPIQSVMKFLRMMYKEMPSDCFIANTTVTGYGEGRREIGRASCRERV